MQTANALVSNLGLSRNPFPPTPDAGSYFFTAHLQEQFAELMHCIKARKGFVLLTGEVGLGKSTLVRRLLDTLPAENTCSALVFNTFLQGPDLLAAVLRDFGLDATGQLEPDMATLNVFLLQRHAENKTCLLVVDDAQNLKVESLELVRLLCNLETGQEKLLQIFLAGQPELNTILAGQALRQLKSRIVKHASLRGLRRDEVSRYFEFRITAAGGSGRISLHPAAAGLLHRATNGNLRQIHLVLDRCLYGLAASGKRQIDKALMNAALNDLSMRAGPRWPQFQLNWSGVAGLVSAGSLIGAAVVYASQGAGFDVTAGWQPMATTATAATTATHTGARPVLANATLSSAVMHTPAPVAAEPSEVAEITAVAENCVEQLAKSAVPGMTMVSQWLPETVAQRLKQTGSVCLSVRNKQMWATWYANPMSREAQLHGASQATRQMQERLVRFGWLKADLIDGYNGPQTQLALQGFQQSVGIKATGSPDELTYMLLEKLHAG